MPQLVIDDIKVPLGDLDWLVDLFLQRTGPALSLKNGDFKLEAVNALNEWFQTGTKEPLRDLCQKQNFIVPFLVEVFRGASAEAENIMSLGPQVKFGRICSIGPGNGIVELFLLRTGFITDLLLVDIENSAQHAHGWSSRGSGYASLDKARVFLAENCVSPTRIFTCNPVTEPLPKFEFDLLISLISMGFHYPCDEYVDFILSGSKRTLGSCLIDCRLNAVDAGYARLIDCFNRKVIFENAKFRRILLSRDESSKIPL